MSARSGQAPPRTQIAHQWAVNEPSRQPTGDNSKPRPSSSSSPLAGARVESLRHWSLATEISIRIGIGAGGVEAGGMGIGERPVRSVMMESKSTCGPHTVNMLEKLFLG